MIDTKELRKAITRHGTRLLDEDEVTELLDRLEAAESVLKDFGTTAQEVECWLERYRRLEQRAEAQRAELSTEKGWVEDYKKQIVSLWNRLEASEHECTEQARLNGIGAECELALMAKLESAEKERDALRAENETLAANLRGKHSTAGATYAHLIAERDALRAKVSDLTINVEYLGNLKTSYEELIGDLQEERDELRTQLSFAKDELNRLQSEVIYWKEQKEPGAAGWRAIACKLRAKIEAMENQDPAMWANSSNIISAKINKERRGAGEQHTCSETKTAYHDAPLYLAPGAKGEEK